MQKLALKLDHLAVQSFETTTDSRAGRGTVVGHADDTCDALACAETGATQIYTCAGCETYDEPCNNEGGPEDPRRIIVYQSPG